MTEKSHRILLVADDRKAVGGLSFSLKKKDPTLPVFELTECTPPSIGSHVESKFDLIIIYEPDLHYHEDVKEALGKLRAGSSVNKDTNAIVYGVPEKALDDLRKFPHTTVFDSHHPASGDLHVLKTEIHSQLGLPPLPPKPAKKPWTNPR